MPQAMSRPSRAGLRLRLTSLDGIVSVGIVGLVVALCFQEIAALAVKARLAGVFFAMTAERRDSHELVAITGGLPAPGTARTLQTLSTPMTSFELAANGAGLLAHGSVGEDAQPFAISFTPALSDDGEASVRWLCGRHRVPAGWHAASAPAVLVLPHGASFSICRDDGAEAS
jgi:hypothetical protein